MNTASNTHNLVDASPIDGVFQTVVAVDSATCDVVRNVRSGNWEQ